MLANCGACGYFKTRPQLKGQRAEFREENSPFLFEDLYENQVQLVQVTLLPLHCLIIFRTLHDNSDHEIPDSRSLFVGQDLPTSLDELVHDL